MKAIGLKTEWGGVLAFPELASTFNENDMQSWDEAGGHGHASEDWVLDQERLTRDEETELIAVYTKLYDLDGEAIEPAEDGDWESFRAMRRKDIMQWVKIS